MLPCIYCSLLLTFPFLLPFLLSRPLPNTPPVFNDFQGQAPTPAGSVGPELHFTTGSASSLFVSARALACARDPRDPFHWTWAICNLKKDSATASLHAQLADIALISEPPRQSPSLSARAPPCKPSRRGELKRFHCCYQILADSAWPEMG